MSVAVAHQAASSSRTIALREAAREAQARQTDLAVLHVVESLDLDIKEAYEAGVRDEIESALSEQDTESLSWSLFLATAKDDDVVEELLNLADQAGADLLVIGARRRSPIGKFLLGSVTQSLILNAPMTVMVVKSEV